MMKKLFLFTLLISSLLIVGCGNNVSDPTNDGGTVVESSYKANGISSVYEGKGYKFFSMDGNTYQITIKDGGISGLGTYSFDKSSIYSKNADGDDDYTGTYKEYIVYNNSYNGIIMFSKTDDNVGTIYLKNTDGTIIEGFIDIDRTDRVIPTEYKGTWQRQNISGSTVSVTIDDTFVTISNTKIIKIPVSFFINDASTGKLVVKENFYKGTEMSLNDTKDTLTISLKRSSINWDFQIDANNKITIASIGFTYSSMSLGSFKKIN